eukprot:scaffold21508_cov61-Phaeocystis_antarctica.AAC.6
MPPAACPQAVRLGWLFRHTSPNPSPNPNPDPNQAMRARLALQADRRLHQGAGVARRRRRACGAGLLPRATGRAGRVVPAARRPRRAEAERALSRAAARVEPRADAAHAHDDAARTLVRRPQGRRALRGHPPARA